MTYAREMFIWPRRPRLGVVSPLPDWWLLVRDAWARLGDRRATYVAFA